MSTRLTREMRAHICNVLSARAFKTKLDALSAEEAKLFDQLVDAYLGVHKDAFMSLPADWNARSCYVNLDSWGHENQVSGKYRNIPNTIDNGCIRKGEIPDELHAAASAFLKRRRKLQDQQAKFKEEARGVLNACTTSKQLYTAWPELAEVYTIDEKTATGTALVPCVATLNKVLGLPSEVTA